MGNFKTFFKAFSLAMTLNSCSPSPTVPDTDIANLNKEIRTQIEYFLIVNNGELPNGNGDGGNSTVNSLTESSYQLDNGFFVHIRSNSKDQLIDITLSHISHHRKIITFDSSGNPNTNGHDFGTLKIPSLGEIVAKISE